MPAAAVTPAPIAYIKAAAVKKLVVGSQAGSGGSPYGVSAGYRLISCMLFVVLLTECYKRSARLL